MPYKLSDDKLSVMDDKGKVVKKHKTPKEAMDHMKALMANMPEAHESTQPDTRATVLRESLALAESTIDEESLTVRNVTLIKAGWSTNADKSGNRRYYPAETLKASVDAFEGAVVHVNHPGRKDNENLPEGDAMGVRGYYENVRWDEAAKSLKGDQVLIRRESTEKELWPIIKEAATRKPDLIQLSINAVGQTRLGEAEGKKAVVIESIVKGDRPNRVDIVTSGAAGGTYAGSILTASSDDELTDRLLEAVSFEQWRESHPDYLDRLKAEWKTTRDTEALRESKDRAIELQNEITRLTEAGRANETELANYRRAEMADRLLETSGLPNRLRPTVKAQLIQEADEPGMKRVLESEKTKYAQSPKPPIESPAPNLTVKPVLESAANPIRIRGLSESNTISPKPNESAEEYRVRYLREAQTH